MLRHWAPAGGFAWLAFFLNFPLYFFLLGIFRSEKQEVSTGSELVKEEVAEPLKLEVSEPVKEETTEEQCLGF